MAKKIWEITDTGEKKAHPEMQFKIVQRPRSSWKNPALAFSLSLLVWGTGQFYNGQWKRGLLFSLLMALYGWGVVFVVLHWHQVSTLLAAYGVPPLFLMTTCSALYLCGIVLWMFQAVQAYTAALATRPGVFRGVPVPVLPMFASLVVPGWGQMLNGQRKKGTGFLTLSLAGFAAAPVLIGTPLFWPMLQTASEEPLKTRWEYAVNRIRMYGLLRGAMPQIRLTIALRVYLLISLGLQHLYTPDRFYATLLQRWERTLSSQEMVILPQWIHRSRQLFFPEDS